MAGIKSIDVVLWMNICLGSSYQIATHHKIDKVEDDKWNSKLELNAIDKVLFRKESL